MTSRRDQQPRNTLRFDVNQQRVFPLVPTSFPLAPEIRQRVSHSLIARADRTKDERCSVQQSSTTQPGQADSATLRYHVCRASVSNVQHTFLDNCGKGCGSHTIKCVQSVKLEAMCNVQVWRVDGQAQTLLLTRVAKTTSTCQHNAL